jgi:type I restriction enzyme, S subunit
VARVISGYAFKSESFQGQGIPVVKIKNIRVGVTDLSNADCVPESFRELPRRFHVIPGDILISLTGSHLTQPNSVVGRVAWHGNDQPACLLNQRAGKVIIEDPSACDPSFLFYALSRVETVREIAQMAHGAASQANVSPSQVESVTIDFPEIEEQRRISRILAAYDDLIENNRQRIKILEDMARTAHREWFVHFRYPLCGDIETPAPEMGGVPADWPLVSIGQQFMTVLGGTPSRDKAEYWNNGTVAWINSGKVNDLRVIAPSDQITELALAKSAAKLMPKHTTVIAITGATLGQVSYLEIETSANQSVVGIVDSTERYAEWIYLTMQERIHEVIQHASGGAQQHINKEIINAVTVALPPAGIADAFGNLVRPMFEQLATLLFQNDNLKRTRDLLLPKLIGGT